MRYRNIYHGIGIGEIVIMAVPRDRTIPRMKASLMCAQQLTRNSQGDNYRKDGHWMPPERPR